MAERVVTRAILLDKNGRVLLGKRARNTAVGQWALVGGRPDDNETPEAAIKREVKEELDIKFEPQFYMEDTSSAAGEVWQVHYFTGLITEEIKRKEDEISAVKFILPEDLNNLDIAFDHREILEEFFRKEGSKV